jgi:hypothetical protein
MENKNDLPKVPPFTENPVSDLKKSENKSNSELPKVPPFTELPEWANTRRK